jgi:hypothetical protein
MEMGLGRTRHAALGRAAMRRGFRLVVVMSAAMTAALTAGCGSIGAAAGAIAGVTTGVVSSNPAIGIGVGIAVQAVTDEAVNREMKSLHGEQQDAIALAAGGSTLGESQPWSIKHTLPVENGHGQVRVLREFSSALATCREFAFSLADGDAPDAHQDWFIASACKQESGWKWASAEPAVARWGNLQ